MNIFPSSTAPINPPRIPKIRGEPSAGARQGFALALISGMLFSLDAFLIKHAVSFPPFTHQELLALIPLVCAGLHDFCAACVTLLINWRARKLSAIYSALFRKPVKSLLIGSLIGAIFGTGSYMAALQLADASLVLPITSLYPAIAAVLSVFMLKERISLSAWAGVLFCVSGAAAIGYGHSGTESLGSSVGSGLFYWGMALAALAAMGWALEGVCAATGMKSVEPSVALGIYYLLSATLYCGILLPLGGIFLAPAGVVSLFRDFLVSRGTLILVCAGCLGAVSYFCWYAAMKRIGVSRATALNVSYALWGLLLAFFFTDENITGYLVLGAMIIFIGILLVIGKQGLLRSDANPGQA